jgi:hypothetical protein
MQLVNVVLLATEQSKREIFVKMLEEMLDQ